MAEVEFIDFLGRTQIRLDIPQDIGKRWKFDDTVYTLHQTETEYRIIGSSEERRAFLVFSLPIDGRSMIYIRVPPEKEIQFKRYEPDEAI